MSLACPPRPFSPLAKMRTAPPSGFPKGSAGAGCGAPPGILKEAAGLGTVQMEVLGQGQLGRVQKLLQGVPGGMDRAMKGAMGRAVSHLRAHTAQAIQGRYDISAANIRANGNVHVRYTYQEGVQAAVTFMGGKIPLFRYGGASPGGPAYDTSRRVPMMIHGQWRMAHPGLAAHGHQLKSTSPALLGHAFVARMASGHVGIFARDGGSISEIMGSSVPQMLGSPQVAGRLAEGAMDKFKERLGHEVLRLLNGW